MMVNDMASKYTKLSIALQNYLHGARYHEALRAFDFGKSIHTGIRKDGVTPEFQHQIEIALYITTLKDIQDEEGCIIAALLHDVLEDYPLVASQTIRNMFGEERALSVVRLSKCIEGIPQYTDIECYFDDIAIDVRSSIVKGADRFHNLSTMHSAFTFEKQNRYLQETQQLFLPMLKVAAEKFPQQYLTYMNIRTMLKTQVRLIQHTLTAYDALNNN